MDETPGVPDRTRPDRTLLAVVVAVAALVVLALVVVLTRGEAQPVDDSTPAGVVQRYTEAVIAGDAQAARDDLTVEARDDCEPLETGTFEDVRVTLATTTERDDVAEVEVSVVTMGGGGLFGPAEYREDASFRLVRDGPSWAIDAAPWQFAVCANAAQ